jgi:hypothetical protein
LQLEPLEDRTVLSQIIWTNRGDAVNDTDGFNAVFGAQAGTARAVVDAGVHAWQQVIADFNFNDGEHPFLVTISMDSKMGLGASADVNLTDDDDPNTERPTSGQILIQTGNDGHGSGWFLDPTPNDSAEFRGRIINAFAGDATPGGPAVGLADLFTAVVLEMTHCIGLNNDSDNAFTEQDPYLIEIQPTQDDAAFPGRGHLFVFAGPSGDNALFTSNNGASTGQDTGDALHTAEPVPGNVFGNFFFGAQDSDNAQSELGRRYLPSQLDALILQDVYGYSINWAQGFGTFYANLDSTTGNLLVRGGEAGESVYGPTDNSDDHIVLNRSGSNLEVSVDVGKPVPGTGPAVPLASFFDFGSLNSITIQAEDGNDVVTLDSFAGNLVPSGGITIDGGSGFNELQILGTPGNDIFDLSGNQIILGGDSLSGTLTYSNFQLLTIAAGDGQDIINVHSIDPGVMDAVISGGVGDDSIGMESCPAGTHLFFFGNDGNDTFSMSPVSHDLGQLFGTISIDGGNGFDQMFLYDDGSIASASYVIRSDAIVDFSASFQYAGLDNLELDAAMGSNSINVQSTQPGTTTVINAGPGSDMISVDSNGAAAGGSVNGVQSPLIVNGQGGVDNLTLQDQSDFMGNRVTVTAATVGAMPGDTFFGPHGYLLYAAMTQLLIEGGFGGNFIDVLATAPGTATTILAGQADDNVLIGGNLTTSEVSGLVDGIRSDLVVYGQDGVNTLTVNDSDSSASKQVTVTGTQVGAAPGDAFFGPGGRLFYFDFHTLTLDGGHGGNTILVQSTNPGTTTVVNAGKGANTVLMDSNGLSPGGTINNILSPVFVNGQGMTQLTVEDADQATTTNVDITKSDVGAAIGNTFWPAGAALSYSGLSALTVDTGMAGDFITVRSTALNTATTINAGPGNDVIKVDSNGGQAGGTVKNIASPLTINGQADTNALTLEDSSTALLSTVTVTGTQIGASAGDTFFGPGASLTYSGIGFLKLDAGSGGNFFYIIGTCKDTKTTVNAGQGSDHIFLGFPGNSVSNVQGKLTIDGQGGQNDLSIVDTHAGGPTKVTLTSTQVGVVGDTFFPLNGSLTYANLRSLTLAAGAFGNTIQVRSTASGTQTKILAGAGDDTVIVGVSPGLVQGIVSGLTVDGGLGTNRLRLQDAADATARQVTLTGGGLVGAGPGDNFFGPNGSLSYANFGLLTLNGGPAGNTFYVEGTLKGTTTTLNPGSGASTVVISSAGPMPGGTAKAIVSPLIVNGGGNTSVSVDNSGDLAAEVASVSTSSVGAASTDNYFGVGGKLIYSGLTSLTLNGGSGGNLFKIFGQAVGTAMTLNTGAGQDVVNVYVSSASAYQNLNVNGGLPNAGVGDTLHIFVSGGGVLTKHPFNASDGYVLVAYPGGSTNRIDYQGIETILP